MALDTLEIFGDEYTGVAGFKATDDNGNTKTYIRPQGTISISANGSNIDVSTYASANVSVSPNLESKSISITPTESSQSQTVSPTTPTYDGLSSVNVTVNAISSTYIGSGITQRDSTDLSASGATVTAPSGYYASNATITISSGTEGTPVATKGAVNNHSISVTPSVTNTAGYIPGGSHTGTAVTVTAAELVSGTKSISNNGTAIDVTNYASVNVAVPVPSLTTVTKSYTPSETAQSETVTASGLGYDGISSISISVGAISSTYVGTGITRRDSTDLSASGATVTAPSGYYENAATYTIGSGSATPPSTISGSSASVSIGINELVFTKTISVTPVVSAGYISAGTAGNVTVSLSANITSRNSSDLSTSGATVTAPAGYYPLNATATVASGTEGTPTATKGVVSSHSIAVTPSVTNVAGYISGGTHTGTAVTVTAAELVSGSETKTSNGTYDVTNLAQLIVNVSSGANNIVEGTFTTGATRNQAGSVTLSYSGNGYPIAAMVFIDGGAYNNTTSGNTTWYNSVSRYDCGVWYMSKARTTSTPTYSTSGEDNYGVTAYIYKNSTSNSTSYTRNSSMTSNTYSSSNATTGLTCVRFKSKTTLSYWVGNAASNNIGFPPSTKMKYIVVYSS